MAFSARIVSTLLIGLALTATAVIPQQAAAQGTTPTPSAPPALNAQAVVSPNAGSEDRECSLFNMGACVGAAVATIAWIFLVIAASIAGLAMTSLDFAVKLLVFDFGILFGNSTGLLAGWGVLRDIGNMLLLFGFIAIGIQTILNINHYNVGKTLPRLIIFAVLLNFSLFVTEAIIDGTNGIATVVYTQGDQAGNAGSSIGEQAGLTSLVDSKQVENLAFENDFIKAYSYLLFSVFLLIIAFALFSGAILLVTRAVVLVFLMITSPIGFAGMAIPQLNKVADDWWSALIGNSLFAPVYLILLLVSLKVLEALPKITGNGASGPNLVQAAGTDPAAMGGATIIFLLATGFLILSVMAAKQFSMVGAKFATQTAGNLAFGAPAFLGRRTIGAASNAGSRAIARSKFGRTDLGRITAGIVGSAANKSFDIRGIKQVGKTLDSENKIGKKGIQGIIKEQAEKKAHWDEELEAQDGARYNELSMDIERYKRLAEKAKKNGNTKRADKLEKKAEKLEGISLKTVAGKKKKKEKFEKERDPLLTDQKALLAESKGIVSKIQEINQQLGETGKLIAEDNKKLAEERKKADDAADAAKTAAIAAGLSAPEVTEAESRARRKNEEDIKQLLTKITMRETRAAELSTELTGRQTRKTEVDRELLNINAKVDGVTKKIGHLEHEIHDQEGAYAQEVENMSRGLVSMASLGRKANRDAAMKIRKHHKQTPTDKQFAQLMAGMKAAGGGGDHGDSHGGGHAAPAKAAKGPAPAGGGHH